MKVCCLLVSINTIIGPTVLRPSEPQEPLPLDGVVLPVVVEVHLDVGGADVHLVTAVALNAVIVGLFLVVSAIHKLITAIIHWCHSSEAILEGLVHLLVPFTMSDHFFLLCEIFALAHGDCTVKMLTIVHVFAGIKPTFKARPESLEISCIVSCDNGLTRDQAMHSLGHQQMRRNGGHPM